MSTQSEILELIASGEPVTKILRSVCIAIENQQPQIQCAAYIFTKVGQNLNIYPGKIFTKLKIQDLDRSDKDGAVGEDNRYQQPYPALGVVKGQALFNVKAGDILTSQHPLRVYSLQLKDGSLRGYIELHDKESRALTSEQDQQISFMVRLAEVAIRCEEDRQRAIVTRKRFNSLFFNNPEPVFSFDLKGVVQQANKAAQRVFGSKEGEKGRNFIARIYERDREKTLKYFREASTGFLRRLEVRAYDEQGNLLYLDASILPIIVDERVEGVLAVTADFTAKRHTEQRLKVFQQSVESCHDSVVIVDAQRRDLPIVYVNPAFERLTGYSERDVIGTNCRLLLGKNSNETSKDKIRRKLSNGQNVRVVIRSSRKYGSLFWSELNISPVRDGQGRIARYIGIQRDVTEERRRQEELIYSAKHDPLTGLPNRSLLEQRLHMACENLNFGEKQLAILFVDLDGFKPINDSMGHSVGDKVLKEVAGRISNIVRHEDTVARIGGDEFVVILTSILSKEEVANIVDRLLLNVAKKYVVDGVSLYLSASVGVAHCSVCSEDPMGLIRQADLAMYKAKQMGRNNYQWFTNDLQRDLDRRISLRNELGSAVFDSELELHYQPQVQCSTNKVVGLEALLRWNHPEQGYISPQEFVPVAESTGQIVTISEWVLNIACRDLRLLAERGFQNVTMAVNVSPVLFRQCNLVAMVRNALIKYNLEGRQLELEVTESLMLDDCEANLEVLRQLKNLGVSLAIDDFGTGYSSLSYLKLLPVDKIKIDRSLISGVVDSHHEAAIAKGIITIAKHLGLKVVAEGVESREQFLFFTDSYCDELQGFYFAKPMLLSVLIDFLKAK